MFKRIRDFIYDINDIFVALIILALAAGVIYWRSSSIVEYPKYLAEQSHTNTSADIDFSDIDLEPEHVDPNYNPNPEDQGSFVDPDAPPADNTVDPSDVPVPDGGNTADNTNDAGNTNDSGNTDDPGNGNDSGNTNEGNNAENTNSADNGNDNTGNNTENTDPDDNGNNTENTDPENNENSGENTSPKAVNFMLYANDSWINIADRLSLLGLIADTDAARMEFIMTVSRIGLQAKGQPGSYQLTKGMSYEEIIRTLCRLN